MNRCRKKVLIGFGGILFVVLSFIPYRSLHSIEKRKSGSNLITRTTTADRGFLFLPRFFGAVSRNGTMTDGARDTYRLDAVLWAGEIAAVLILAALDGFLLCSKGPSRRPGQGF